MNVDMECVRYDRAGLNDLRRCERGQAVTVLFLYVILTSLLIEILYT
jgi:hypothetical protein